MGLGSSIRHRVTVIASDAKRTERTPIENLGETTAQIAAQGPFLRQSDVDLYSPEPIST